MTARSRALRAAARIASAWLFLAAATQAADTDPTAAVRAVLAAQQADWNRGDLDAFMRGYWDDATTRFAGGDHVEEGWRATLERYRRAYPDATAMGRLDFDLVEVRALSDASVYVFGRWRLTTTADAAPGASKDSATDATRTPHGLFTLIFERKDGRWVITRDHTSSAGG